VPETIASNSNVTIIKGTLDDEAVLMTAASCGATIFVSFAGPTTMAKGTVSLYLVASPRTRYFFHLGFI
jgi:hypothetical protein